MLSVSSWTPPWLTRWWMRWTTWPWAIRSFPCNALHSDPNRYGMPWHGMFSRFNWKSFYYFINNSFVSITKHLIMLKPSHTLGVWCVCACCADTVHDARCVDQHGDQANPRACSHEHGHQGRAAQPQRLCRSVVVKVASSIRDFCHV